MNLAGGQKGAVSEYHSNWGDWPGTNSEAGVAKSASIRGKYVAGVDVRGRSVIATIRGQSVARGIMNRHLILEVTATSGSYVWHCVSDDIDDKYLPANCRGKQHLP
jgi:type IV pilus assembly protein PilA